jgi:hypothetical protein
MGFSRAMSGTVVESLTQSLLFLSVNSYRAGGVWLVLGSCVCLRR